MSVAGKIFVDLTFGQPTLDRVKTTYLFSGISISGEGRMSIKIPAGKGVIVTIEPLDKYGNPTKFENDPVWQSSDSEVFTVIATPANSYSAEIRSLGPMGRGQWTGTGDADLGEGVREIIALNDVEIVPGEAESVAFSYGPIID